MHWSRRDPEFSHDSPGCVYSFDLDGNVIEMNAAMADVLGYAREEAARMNLGQLLEPESWKDSREQILAQLGGGGPQWVNLTAIARDGSPCAAGRSAAIVVRTRASGGGSGCRTGAGRSAPTRARRLVENPEHQTPGESSRFAEQLKQLHRLSTTSYVTLEQALQDHLETGCRLFHLPVGVLLQVEGFNGAGVRLRTALGADGLKAAP